MKLTLISRSWKRTIGFSTLLFLSYLTAVYASIFEFPNTFERGNLSESSSSIQYLLFHLQNGIIILLNPLIVFVAIGYSFPATFCSKMETIFGISGQIGSLFGILYWLLLLYSIRSAWWFGRVSGVVIFILLLILGVDGCSKNVD